MDYLFQNLNNSLTLPYDVLKNIHDYADPLRYIRKELTNPNILNNKMYQKAKKYVISLLNQEPDIGFYTIFLAPFDTQYIITFSNIDDDCLKDIIINNYKSNILWRHKRLPEICGLNPKYPHTYRRLMIFDLEIHMAMLYELNPTIKYIYYKRRSLKQLYQLWVKL